MPRKDTQGKSSQPTKIENSEFVDISMLVLKMPEIDLTDSKQVAKRISDYFTLHEFHNKKPTIEGYSLALGIESNRLNEVMNGKGKGKYELPPDCIAEIKKGHQVLKMLWEHYMINGKINPVAGIFLGKVQFGYNETQKIEVHHTSDIDTLKIDEIKQRYLDKPVIDVESTEKK